MCVYLQKCRIRSLINSLMLLNSLLDRLPHTTKAREVTYVRKQQESLLYSVTVTLNV